VPQNAILSDFYLILEAFYVENVFEAKNNYRKKTKTICCFCFKFAADCTLLSSAF
jgi:hypothetical protein